MGERRAVPETSRGRLIVDLLTSLADEMELVAGVFPAAGPPRQSYPRPMAGLARDLDHLVGPEVLATLYRWLACRDSLDGAAEQLERLTHDGRAEPGGARETLRARILAVRDAREELNRAASELREAIARDLDREA